MRETLRMFRIALRLVWPYVFMPWRSPLLRWRMETYGIRDASGRPLTEAEIGLPDMLRFLSQNRGQLLRFLRWAARL